MRIFHQTTQELISEKLKRSHGLLIWKLYIVCIKIVYSAYQNKEWSAWLANIYVRMRSIRSTNVCKYFCCKYLEFPRTYSCIVGRGFPPPLFYKEPPIWLTPPPFQVSSSLSPSSFFFCCLVSSAECVITPDLKCYFV